MSHFEEMKKYIQENEGCDICYDSPFSDYMDDLYGTACQRLSEVYEDLYIEPSTQCGVGGVFANYTKDGKGYATHWDFEHECECIADYACEAETEEELIQSIKDFINSQLEDAEEVCDDDESEDN